MCLFGESRFFIRRKRIKGTVVQWYSQWISVEVAGSIPAPVVVELL